MSFVLAFFVCGALCVMAQIMIDIKLIPPVILNIFLALGGLLTPVGAMTWLLDFGQGGCLCVICGAGNAFAQAAYLAFQGSPKMFIAVALLFFVTITIGIVAGEIRFKIINTPDKH
jgi:hypothetical protein